LASVSRIASLSELAVALVRAVMVLFLPFEDVDAGQR
jgi:hypothetical protein